MFRLGASEDMADFTRRRFCSAKCAGIDLVAKSSAAAPSLPKPKPRPLAKPTARPLREPRKRNKPEHVIVETDSILVEISTATRTWRTWERAKLEGPSEEAYYAAERYGRMHRLTAEETLRLWGYRKTEIVEVKKAKEN